MLTARPDFVRLQFVTSLTATTVHWYSGNSIGIDQGFPSDGVGYAREKLRSALIQKAECAVCACRNSTPGSARLVHPTVIPQKWKLRQATNRSSANLLSRSEGCRATAESIAPANSSPRPCQPLCARGKVADYDARS